MNRKLYFLMIPLVISLALVSYKFTYGFFSDGASSLSNTFAAASVFPTPSINPGDVVINEINWGGSTINGQGSDDEWLELRNMTNNPISIDNWKITGAVSGAGDLNIVSGIISANGFFLISNFDETISRINIIPDLVTSTIQLDNGSAQYILKDNNGNVIDTADDGLGNPLAGDNGNPKKSMERNDTPGDGIIVGSWHSATSAINMDSEVTELGTPKAGNSAP